MCIRDRHAKVSNSVTFHRTQILHSTTIAEVSDKELRALWDVYRDGRRDVDPILSRLDGSPGEIITRRRREVVNCRDWYNSLLVNEYSYPTRCDDALYSEVRLSDGRLHRLSFVRAWGDPRFDEQDTARVHRYHEQLVAGWMAASG